MPRRLGGRRRCGGPLSWVPTPAQRTGPRQVVDQPLRALLGWRTAEAELSRPPRQPGRREQVEALGRAERLQGRAEKAADELLADVFQRPRVLLLAAAEQGVDELEEEVFEKIVVALVYAGPNAQLPCPSRPLLDPLHQLRL